MLILGMIVGLILGLILGLNSGLILQSMFGLIGELMFGLIVGLILGMIGGLIFGLIWWLIWWLIFGLIDGLKQELKERSRPNQGIWNSLQSVLWTTAFSYPLGVILGALGSLFTKAVQASVKNPDWFHLLSSALPDSLLVGLFWSLIFGIVMGGGLACIQHFSLRLVLWQSGTIPWNFARFLNYCVERRLLLRVGGRYRFLHRELLDYFAQLPSGTQIK